MNLEYEDQIRIILVLADDYGDSVVDEEQVVPAAVEMSTGMDRGGNRATVTADAVAYIDPENPWVLQNLQWLRGAYVVVQLFDSEAGDSWFKIDDVTVARDHQLSNQIDNILLSLSKTVAFVGVS